jgi:hypothetical protein
MCSNIEPTEKKAERDDSFFQISFDYVNTFIDSTL